jgi:IS30 family transposase
MTNPPKQGDKRRGFCEPLSKDTISQIHQLAKAKISQREIARKLNTTADTVRKYLRIKQAEDLELKVTALAPDLQPEDVSPQAIKDHTLWIIQQTLSLYIEKIKLGHIMAAKDLSSIMSLYTDFDKIKRLDDGTPTEILDYEVMSLKEIKLALLESDAFKEKPKLDVEPL